MLRSEHVRLAGLPWGKSALHRRRPVSRVRLWEESQTGPWRGAVASSRPREGLFRHALPFSFSRANGKANGRANLGERKAFLILPRPSSHPLLASTCPVQPSRPVFFLASFPSLLSHFLPNYSNLICLPTLLMGFVFFIVLCVKSKLVFFFPISTLIIRTSTTKFPK